MIKPAVEATRGKEHPRVVDVACDSGGFLMQLALALPRAHLGGVDLSASYIAQARAVASAGVSIDLAVENAEQLPMRDSLVDAFTCSYLFHELPRQARRGRRQLFRALADDGLVFARRPARAQAPYEWCPHRPSLFARAAAAERAVAPRDPRRGGGFSSSSPSDHLMPWSEQQGQSGSTPRS